MVEGILNVAVSAAQTDEFLQYASGGRLLPGSVPLAHRYGGHQVEFVITSGKLGIKKMNSRVMNNIFGVNFCSL